MLTLSPQVKVFLALQPTDMRKSFDSLAAIVQEALQLDPLNLTCHQRRLQLLKKLRDGVPT